MKKFTSRLTSIWLVLLAFLFGSLTLASLPTTSVFATPDEIETNQPSNQTPDEEEQAPDNGHLTPDQIEMGITNDTPADGESADADTATNTCQEQAGSLSWVICPVTNTIATAVDALYGFVSEQLEISPISSDDTSPIYRVWQYMRDLTNIVFIIFILIVIYSQVTGVGLNNYGIKRVLPRLIIAVILVNLSFIVCSLAVDLSNIIGASLVDFFESIQDTVFSGATIDASQISWTNVVASVIGGAGLAGIGVVAAGGLGAVFWMLVLALLSALISVAIGLITIGLRQGLVSILIMISPLAFVAYLLPNTEKWFNKWKDMLFQMLIFYPMFSFLFGASRLVGWTMVLSADSMFMVVVGLAIQVLPLFLAVSLMKMSGTILGAVSSKLGNLANPARRGLAGWAGANAERRRQHYLANNTMPGAKLRNYMAYRQQLRELDTQNAASINKSRAATRAYIKATSSTGRDSEGNDTYKKRPNKYTRTAKMASLQGTRADVAKAAHSNTLSEFGDVFRTAEARKLGAAHGDAYLDAMKEQFRAVNDAQSDQEFLLGTYLKAQTDVYRDPSAYNRLIKGAAGSLGHNGETSIMGQVIARSAAIEARRRSEATIMMNKFGVDKPMSRAMMFDCASIDDDGFETDEFGKPIEDHNFKHIHGKRAHREWDKYIGVHKKTGAEITAAEYTALSDAERKQYNRIRYFDIVDDNGDPVQRVYSDDAGYMKELIIRDITIGDPINRRYAQSIGLADPNAPDKTAGANETGLLRKYHSTISAAILSTKYKEHAAEMTPMITAQADRGYITTNGQYLIADIDSTTKSTKAGSFLQNDAYAINTWNRIIASVANEEEFNKLFSDADIANYRNVNGLHLKGMRLVTDENGNQSWQPIDRNDPTLTVEDQKNFIKHGMIPDLAKKLFGMMNRNMSPNILDAQKPDTTQALINLLKTVGEASLNNTDENIPIEQRLNPDPARSPMSAQNPRVLTQMASEYKASLERRRGNNPDPASGPATGADPAGIVAPTNPTLHALRQSLNNAAGISGFEDFTNLRTVINDCFAFPEIGIEAICSQLRGIFDSSALLQPYAPYLETLLEQYENFRPDTTDAAIEQLADSPEFEQRLIDSLERDLSIFLDQNGII